MKKSLIILGIIILGGLIYFAATTKTGVTPPSVSDSPPPAGKAPVIASITPSKTSSCCVNIEGEGFLTDEATNEVIWTHKEKGFKIWGGGWLSMDGKNLIRTQIPVDNGEYNVIVRNRNGTSNPVSYSVDWTGVHGVPPLYIIDVKPLNTAPGGKIELKTNFELLSEGNSIEIRVLPLAIGKIEKFIFEDTLDFNRDTLVKTKGFLIESRSENFTPPPPEFVIPITNIQGKTAIFNLPTSLKEDSEYLIRISARNISDSPYILYKTGK